MSSANQCRYSRGLKRLVPGSARVSRVWRWCLAIANFAQRDATVEMSLQESPFRRDVETSTRDACATETCAFSFGATIARILRRLRVRRVDARALRRRNGANR